MQATTSDIIKPQELEILEKMRAWNLIDDFYLFLTRPDAHSRLVTGVMGWQWEDTFREICLLRGLECANVGLNTKHDWLINGHRVQCKFSNASPRVDIRNKDKNSGRRYKNDDFEFLALRVHPISSTFIIPISRLIKDDSGHLRGSLDVNEFADCLDNFEVLHAVQDMPKLQDGIGTEETDLRLRVSVQAGEGDEKAGEGWQIDTQSTVIPQTECG